MFSRMDPSLHPTLAEGKTKMDLSLYPTLAEGKTKAVYANPHDESTVYLRFKDDITAGDGVKRDSFAGKGVLDWAVNRDCFSYLNRHGVRTHYLTSPADGISLVRRLDRKIDLEVVSRRVATGSILHWDDVAEGDRFEPVITRFHYKDDALHDPMLDERYVDFMIGDKKAWEYAAMRDMNATVLLLLEQAFAHFGVELVDVKLEYGIVDGELCVIDEMSGGSFRLWPYRRPHPDLSGDNVLAQLAPEQRLDKDTFQLGGEEQTVLDRFGAIAAITAGFADLS